MTLELIPIQSDVVEQQLPSAVVTTENELFVTLLKEYYDWLNQTGQPTEFIQHLLEYGDIDFTSAEFRQHIVSSLSTLIPTNSRLNEATIAKHLTEFLSSKGTFESFQFIMNAIYGEDSVEMEWQGDKVLKASANKYQRTATVAIESYTAEWTDVEGAELIQLSPIPASGIIESKVTTTVSGEIINWITLKTDTVKGKFVKEGTVRALHNSVNRAFVRIDEYYNPVSLFNGTLTFKATTEASRPYENLVVLQLGSDFRATVASFISRSVITNGTQVKLSVTNITGTFVAGNQIYIIAPSIEGLVYTNDDFEYGTVSPSIESITINNAGELYLPGDKVAFFDGNGDNVDAYVSETSAGEIIAVDVVNKGYGYAVGDKVIVNEAFGGAGFDAEVAAVDGGGSGGAIDIVSELNTVTVENGGSGYTVGDTIVIDGGVVELGTAPIELTVATVNAGSLSLLAVDIASSTTVTTQTTTTTPTNTTLSTTLISTTPATVNRVIARVPNAITTAIQSTLVPTSITSVNGVVSIVPATRITAVTATVPSLTSLISSSISSVTSGTPITSAASLQTITTTTNTTTTPINVAAATTTPVVTNVAQSQVTTVTTTTTVTQATGIGYPVNTKLALIDNGTGAVIAGFAAIPTIDAQGKITAVDVTEFPTLSTSDVSVIANGYGASATSITISGGVITAIGGITGGVNYLNPVVTINSTTGSGCVAQAVVSGGIITGITVLNGGSGYVSATITISEAYGSGASFIPSLTTLTTGPITGVTITNRGLYTSLPSCFDVIGKATTGTGVGARFGLNFRANAATVTNSGSYYHSITTSVTGNGTGAVLLPIIESGLVTEVIVINGGQNYASDTSITIPTGYGLPPSTTCTLSPVITNGVITAVNVVTPGSGYPAPGLKSDVTINSGTDIQLTANLAGTGNIINYNTISGGAGYLDTSELTPISITCSGGTGATFIPFITETGEISKVYVANGGRGYSITDTITVTGGAGSSVSLTPVVVGGRVTDVTVVNPGSGYSYGTSILVLGDGTGAVIDPTVETGVTSATVVNGGQNYPSTTTITVNDTGGTPTVTAVIEPVIIDGVITGLNIINKGAGYTTPQLVISGGAPGTGAVLTAEAKRFISGLTITNAGTGYTYAQAFVLGDGTGAHFTLDVEKLGAIQSVTLNNVGAGYTTTPIVTVTDTSGFGAVSKIKINSRGYGFRRLPVLTLADKYDTFGALTATGAKLICYGKGIGSVRQVSFNNHGAEYYEAPKIVFPLKAIVQENVAFIPNEKVFLKADQSVYGYVNDFDYDRNLIEFRGTLTDDFYIVDEKNGTIIDTEMGLQLVDEASGSFATGDTIIGENSFVETTFKYSNRATGTCVIGGQGWSEFKFTGDQGMLNKADSVLADNNRYQDMAYIIRCGRAMIDYAQTLRNTVHPAGYAMFGDVKTQTFLDTSVLNEIGYNKLVVLLVIFSIVDAGFQNEYSTMNELFGDLEKFKHNVPIWYVQDYLLNQTSEYLTSSVAQYITPPLNTANFHTWTASSGIQLIDNSDISPNGLMTMEKLSDLNQTVQCTVTKTVTAVIGNTYSLEGFIKKQVNPQTYPELSLGSNYIRINPETGLYYSNIAINIQDLGDYWWIRLETVATATTLVASVIPARGKIANLEVIDNTVVGSIKVSDAYIRDITGLTPQTGPLLRAWNSNYIPEIFRFLNTDTDVVLSPYP